MCLGHRSGVVHFAACFPCWRFVRQNLCKTVPSLARDPGTANLYVCDIEYMCVSAGACACR